MTASRSVPFPKAKSNIPIERQRYTASYLTVLSEHIRRGECHHCGSEMEKKRYEHKLAITEEIRTEAEEDDCQTEAEQPAPRDGAEFALREAELLANL